MLELNKVVDGENKTVSEWETKLVKTVVGDRGVWDDSADRELISVVRVVTGTSTGHRLGL